MVISNLKLANPNVSVDDAVVNEAIASAVGAILRAGRLPMETISPSPFTTTSGTASYSIPDTMGKIERVWIVEGDGRTKLEGVSLDRFDDDYRYAESAVASGEPTVWTIEGTKLVLYPTPDGTYTISMRGERRSGDLANLPDGFRDAVILGALSVLLPVYMPAFNMALRNVKTYLRAQGTTKREWRFGASVQSHHDYRRTRNVE